MHEQTSSGNVNVTGQYAIKTSGDATNGYKLKNISNETITISGNKTWITDSTNHSDLAATIVLKQNGTEIERKTIYGDTSYSFTKPKYNPETGAVYTYTV